MKKLIVIVGYLLGWIYPISAIIINLLNVRIKLMSAFDFHNDSIMFYLFYGTIFSIITFIIYFAFHYKKYDVEKGFYFTFINVFLYYPSIVCNMYFSDSWDATIPTVILVVDLLVIAYTLYIAPGKSCEKT